MPQPAPVGTQTEESDEVVITVRPGGSFLLNQEATDLAGLRTRLAAAFASGPSRPLFVRGEGDLEYREIAAAIDLGRSVGVYRIAPIS
jgi:biopolymer transport protein ExbD